MAASDPANDDPRELMRALLPAARSTYIKVWELLADPATPIDVRRVARERAVSVAADHTLVAEVLRAREQSLTGDDLLNARLVADELERHADALTRISTVSPVGLATADTLRPDKLGCGRRFRDPARNVASTGTGKGRDAAPTRGSGGAGPASTRGGKVTAGRSGAPGGDRQRGDRPFTDRGPKVDRSALGSSKHDSTLGDDMDEATRSRLEELKRQLEG